MEQYDKVIEHFLMVYLKINLVAIGVLVVALIVLLIFKNVKNRNKYIGICLTLILYVLVEFGIFEIPRVIDLRAKEYIAVENVDIGIQAMNDFDGSLPVFGLGSVKQSDGKSFTVTGTLLIDLPTDSSSYQEFHGTIVYAKHSKQIVDFIIYDEDS